MYKYIYGYCYFILVCLTGPNMLVVLISKKLVAFATRLFRSKDTVKILYRHCKMPV